MPQDKRPHSLRRPGLDSPLAHPADTHRGVLHRAELLETHREHLASRPHHQSRILRRRTQSHPEAPATQAQLQRPLRPRPPQVPETRHQENFPEGHPVNQDNHLEGHPVNQDSLPEGRPVNQDSHLGVLRVRLR